jgi:hypothetical protein
MTDCSKVRYARKIDAKLALMRTNRRDRDEVRIYWHAPCRAYHLTSMRQQP